MTPPRIIVLGLDQSFNLAAFSRRWACDLYPRREGVSVCVRESADGGSSDSAIWGGWPKSVGVGADAIASEVIDDIRLERERRVGLALLTRAPSAMQASASAAALERIAAASPPLRADIWRVGFFMEGAEAAEEIEAARRLVDAGVVDTAVFLTTTPPNDPDHALRATCGLRVGVDMLRAHNDGSETDPDAAVGDAWSVVRGNFRLLAFDAPLMSETRPAQLRDKLTSLFTALQERARDGDDAGEVETRVDELIRQIEDYADTRDRDRASLNWGAVVARPGWFGARDLPRAIREAADDFDRGLDAFYGRRLREDALERDDSARSLDRVEAAIDEAAKALVGSSNVFSEAARRKVEDQRSKLERARDGFAAECGRLRADIDALVAEETTPGGATPDLLKSKVAFSARVDEACATARALTTRSLALLATLAALFFLIGFGALRVAFSGGVDDASQPSFVAPLALAAAAGVLMVMVAWLRAQLTARAHHAALARLRAAGDALDDALRAVSDKSRRYVRASSAIAFCERSRTRMTTLIDSLALTEFRQACDAFLSMEPTEDAPAPANDKTAFQSRFEEALEVRPIAQWIRYLLSVQPPGRLARISLDLPRAVATGALHIPTSFYVADATVAVSTFDAFGGGGGGGRGVAADAPRAAAARL